jgi:hypothetical protein
MTLSDPVVTLEALCDLWVLKMCPVIHLATHLPAEGDLLLKRQNLITDDEQSVAIGPSRVQLAKKGCRPGAGASRRR